MPAATILARGVAASTFAESSGRPFAPTSAFNQPIPASVNLDTNSAAMVSYLASGTNQQVANLYEYAVPVWNAYGTSPHYAVDASDPYGIGFEPFGSPAVAVPIPDGATAATGADGAMVVIDWSTKIAYEFYRAVKTGSVWSCEWGAMVPINDRGTPANPAGGSPLATWIGPLGFGASRLAGVIRCHEIAAGVINHALVFATNNQKTVDYRYPARKTDGTSVRSDAIPAGARLQLDPSINVNDSAYGMNAGERIVARALQVYGAYVCDNTSPKIGVIFEAPSGESDPYPGVGLEWDYFALSHIPWSSCRVLASWNGV